MAHHQSFEELCYSCKEPVNDTGRPEPLVDGLGRIARALGRKQ